MEWDPHSSITLERAREKTHYEIIFGKKRDRERVGDGGGEGEDIENLFLVDY